MNSCRSATERRSRRSPCWSAQPSRSCTSRRSSRRWTEMTDMAITTAGHGAGGSRRVPALASPRKRVSKAAASIVLAVIGAVFLIPLVWIVLSAFDPATTVSVKIPSEPTLNNFSQVMTWELSFRPLWNSTVISFGTAALTVLAAVLAAYPLSRFEMRFRKPFMYSILFGTGLPITAMMVPVYALFVSLRLLNSIPGTILFMSAAALPMAAWMDGASAMTALRRIVVPLMRPGLGVVFIFVFTVAWGNFFVPFVLLFDSSKQPAAVAIFNFFGQYGTIAYGRLAAFSILYATPVLALYVLVQRFSGGSFTMAGAVKG